MPETVTLTVAQAMVRFLSVQHSESDGVEQRLFAGCLDISGHGNVAGFGQALLQAELGLRASTEGKFVDAVKVAKAAEHACVIYVETDPPVDAPDSKSWWDVPVSATSTPESTQRARRVYQEHKAT